MQGVLRQLANFNKQKGVLNVVGNDELVTAEDASKQQKDAKEFDAAAPQHLGDAEDFMDEDELIDDGQHAEAEFEDYDAVSDDDVNVQRHVKVPDRLKITKENQAAEAHKFGIQLPLLGYSEDGDSLLNFSDLFRSLVVVEDSDGNVRNIVMRRNPRGKWIPEDMVAVDTQEELYLADRKKIEKTGHAKSLWIPGEDRVEEDDRIDDDAQEYGASEDEEGERDGVEQEEEEDEQVGTIQEEATAKEKPVKTHEERDKEEKHRFNFPQFLIMFTSQCIRGAGIGCQEDSLAKRALALRILSMKQKQRMRHMSLL